MSRRFCLPSCQPITPFRTVGRFSAPAFSLLHVPDMSYRCSASLPRCWYAFCASAFPDFLLTSPAFLCYTQGGRSKASGSLFWVESSGALEWVATLFYALTLLSRTIWAAAITNIDFDGAALVSKKDFNVSGVRITSRLPEREQTHGNRVCSRLLSSAIPDFYNFLTAS